MCVSPVRGLIPPYPARDRRRGLCDPTRTRTEDTQVKSLLLYQLSYRTKSPRYYTMYVPGETSQRCFTATRHSSNNRPGFDYSPPRNRSGRNSSWAGTSPGVRSLTQRGSGRTRTDNLRLAKALLYHWSYRPIVAVLVQIRQLLLSVVLYDHYLSSVSGPCQLPKAILPAARLRS